MSACEDGITCNGRAKHESINRCSAGHSMKRKARGGSAILDKLSGVDENAQDAPRR